MKLKNSRLAVIAALSPFAVACNQGDSGNVMAPAGNALLPEQVDAALGPELANGRNLLEASGDGNAVEAVDAAEDVEESARPEATEPRSEPEPAPAPQPEEDPAEAAPAENNVVEE